MDNENYKKGKLFSKKYSKMSYDNNLYCKNIFFK
jgi:hypothetical protein